MFIRMFSQVISNYDLILTTRYAVAVHRDRSTQLTKITIIIIYLEIKMTTHNKTADIL